MPYQPRTSNAPLPPSEAAELARTFDADPSDGSALLRLCAHHLAAGSHIAARDALATHLAAASGGPDAVRLRISQAGELMPAQRAELLVHLSVVEAEHLGDQDAALSSVREALQLEPGLESALRRFEELSRHLEQPMAGRGHAAPVFTAAGLDDDPEPLTEIVTDTSHVQRTLEAATEEAEVVTDESYLYEESVATDELLVPSETGARAEGPRTESVADLWSSAGETDADLQATVKIAALPADVPASRLAETRVARPPPPPVAAPRPPAPVLPPPPSSRPMPAGPPRIGAAPTPPATPTPVVTEPVTPTPAPTPVVTEPVTPTPTPVVTEPATPTPPSTDAPPPTPDPAIVRQCESLAAREPDVALGALAALERACTQDVERALVQRTLGRVYETTGDRDRAFFALLRASRLGRPDRALLDEMFRLAVMTGAYAELATAYEESLQGALAASDRIYLHLKLGHLYARELARPQLALKHYGRVEKTDPHNLEALRRVGELLSREERWAEVAEVKLREIEAVWRTTRDIAKVASVKRELARLYEERLDDRHRALLHYRELLDLTPGNPAAIASLERLGEKTLPGDSAGQEAFETLRDLYARQGAYNRLADLLSQAARDALAGGRVIEAASFHREAAQTHEQRIENPGRAFIELVRAIQLLPQGEAVEADGLDPQAIADLTDTLFDDLLRTGRASSSHTQLMAVGEDLALRIGGSRGAALLVRLADTELEDLGEASRAADRLARAVDLSDNDPALEARLEGLYVSRGAWPELAAFYRARADRIADPRARGDLLFRLAEILEDELDDIDRAARVYEEIIDLHGGSPDALVALCRLLEEARNWNGLVDALERAVHGAENLESKKAALLKRARVCLEQLQNPQAARADWQRVVALDPGCVDALQGLAETASEAGDARETAGALESSLSGMRVGEPGRIDGYRRLARLHHDVLQQPARARLAWEEVLREAPKDGEAFARLRTLYRSRGELEALAQLLDERLRADPRQPDARQWRRERIDALEKLGRGEEAGQEWWHAAQADPTDVEALSRLTAFHTARRNWKVVVRVLDDWAAAVTSRTEKADLCVRLAEVQRHELGDEAAAVAAYERAFNLAPDHAGAQTALLEIYRGRDDLDRIYPLVERRLRRVTDPRERALALAELWEVGRRLGEQGDAQAKLRAVEALKEACLLTPGDETLWAALEEALASSSRAAELAGHLEARAARQEGAERATSLLKAAEAHRRGGSPDDDRSRDRVRRCLERARDAAPPDHPVLGRILSLLRAAYTASGAWEALAGILEQMAQPARTSDPEARRALLEELAWVLAERLGRQNEAAAHLDALLAMTGAESERDAVLQRLATLHGGIGDWHRVLALTEERVRLHRGEDREAELRVAAAEIAERRLSDFEAALGHLRAALAVRPGDGDLIARVERVCQAAGRHGEHAAILADEGLRAKDPAARVALLVRAATIKEERLGDLAGARRDLEAALASRDLDSEIAEPARNGLVRILSALRDFDDLAELYEGLVSGESDPEVRADLCVALGLIHEEQRQAPGLALEAYRKALEADPENTAALDAVGRLAEAAGDFDTALEMRRRQAEVAWLPGRRAELLCDAGRVHEQRQEIETALECYVRAAKTDGQSLDAHRGRFRLLRTLGRGDEALEAAASLAAIADEPAEAADLYTIVGEGHEDAGDDAAARSAYGRALAAVPDHGRACAALARLRLREGNAEAALALLEIASHRLDRDREAELLADVHRQAAAASESLGRSEEAGRHLHEAYRLGPTRRATLEALAWHFANREDPVRTHEMLSSLLEHHGEDLSRSERISVLRRVGLALAAMGRPGDAARKLGEALALSPRDRDVLLSLGRIYEETGRWAEVVDVKERLRDLSRDKREQRRLSLEMADLFTSRLHDAGRAADVLAAALAAHPDDPEILARLAEEHEKRGSFEDAAACLERLVRTSKDGGRTRLWVRLGRLRHDRLDAPGPALDAYRKAVEVATDAEEMAHVLTAIRDLVARTRDARPLAEILERLADADGRPGPGEGALLRELAEVRRYQLGDRPGAIEALERALRVDPDDLAAAEDLARLYEREGRDDEAVRALRQVLHSSPFDVDAYRALLRVLIRRGESDGAALVASILVLLEEADAEADRLAAALGEAPAAGRTLPDGIETPGLTHPDAEGPVASLLSVLGHEAVATIAPGGRAARTPPFTADAGPFADRIAEALLGAVRCFGMPAVDVHVGAPEMTEAITAVIGPRPRLAVSPSVIGGSRVLEATALRFQAGRALVATAPSWYAARALDLPGLKMLVDAALTAYGLEDAPARDVGKLARKLERAVPAERGDAAAEAARIYRDHREQYDLQTFREGAAHTAVRAGLLFAGNPEVAVRTLREEDAANRTVLRELVRFAISEEHLALRRALGLGA
jgi:tetratricopeptide (TPR) repeat protein